MIDQLSQEQQWGWAFLLQEHNKGIDRQNEAIDEANSLLPEGGTPQPHVEHLTMEQYLRLRLEQIGDAAMVEINRIKWDTAKQMFNSLPVEQQEALIAQFQIPPVLQG